MRAVLALASCLCLLGCDSSDPGPDSGPPALDAGAPRDAGVDAGPGDAGPPPPMVPANGWTNAVADSDVAASIMTTAGASFDNMATDPDVVIGPPDASLSGTVALGVIGNYVVADLGAGEEAFDGEGDDIRVLELDLSSGGSPEPYTVSVGNDPMGPFTDLGMLIGSGDLDLDGTGLTSVRYVRVESARTADEIVKSAGSPFYPGAEIDAIGAFHPGAATP